MRISNRLPARVVILGMLLSTVAGIEARQKKAPGKASVLMEQGRQAEQRKDWDKALGFYEQALATDPGNIAYQIPTRRARFQAGQVHVEMGLKLRAKGKLDEAAAEFEKAYATDPSSMIAEQELRTTLDMIERNKKKDVKPEEQSLTPAALEHKRELDRLARMEGPPELRSLANDPINLKMNNQPPKVLFETVGKLAGINVVFDPDYSTDPNARKTQSIELSNSTVEQALDYLGAMTKSYWKPLSSNTIFVTADNQAKRREYEDYVVKVFYLKNITTPQDLNEISTTLRSIPEIRRVFPSTSQNALVVRGTTDQVALAEKIINDLDKPKAEVVVDVLVMEASRSRERDLSAAIASNGSAGISTQIQFTPRNPVLLGGSNNSGSTTTTTDTTGSTTTTPSQTYNPYGYNPYLNPYGYSGLSGLTGLTGSTTPTQQLISLARIAHISTNDFSITMPGALLQAVLTDSNTKVLQSPQVRAANGQKASLRIGDKVPIASGGMQPFGGQIGGGYGGLYSSFQFIDVGVNVDVTPTIHGTDEVTLKVELEMSTVRDHVDLGGISQPIIGQRKVTHEIRIKDGEVSLLGGLMQSQEIKSLAGIPGLMRIPILKRIFSSESLQKNESELLIALIPHIVRTQGITDLDLKTVAAGSEQSIRLSYAPREAEQPAKPKAPPQPAAIPGVTPAPPVGPGSPAPAQPGVAPQPAPGGPPVQPQPPGTPQAAAPGPAAAPAAQTRVTFRPATVAARTGSTFTVELDVDNATNLFAAPFHLKFDPQVLRLNEVRAGGLLSSDGKQIIFTRNILNDTGDATVNLNRYPGSGGISGSGALATFTFQVVGKKSTAVTFSQLGLRDAQLQPVSGAPPVLPVDVK